MYAAEGVQNDANKRQENLDILKKELEKETDPQKKKEICEKISNINHFEFMP